MRLNSGVFFRQGVYGICKSGHSGADFFRGKMIYFEDGTGSDWLFSIPFWRSNGMSCPRPSKISFKSVILPKYPLKSGFWHASLAG